MTPRNGYSLPRTRRTPKKPEQWDAWLAAFEREGTVSAACAATGIARSTVYDHRAADSEFAARWRELEDATTDRMEREAYRRAVEGTDRPIVYQGVVTDTVKEYSDTLLIFMLKARRPERYRENVRVEHSGPEGGPIETRELIGGKDPKDLSPATRRTIAAALAKEAEAARGRDRGDGGGEA
jgi:hypothetical protein